MPQLILLILGLMAVLAVVGFVLSLVALAMAVGALGAFVRVLQHVISAYLGTFGSPGPASPSTSEVEPAFRLYVLHQAWADYRTAVTRAWRDCRADLEQAWKGLGTQFTEGGAEFPVACLVAVAVLPAGALLAVLLLLPPVPLALAAGAAIAAATGLHASERLMLRLRGVALICPHHNCHQSVGLPVSLCPRCGAPHRQLVPGRYGIFRRRCQCGEQLPTTTFGGRHLLPSQCPHCLAALEVVLEPGVRVALVGGPATGKTALLRGMLAWLQRAANAGALALTFREADQRKRVNAAARSAEVGAPSGGEASAASPDAIRFVLTPPAGGAVHLHLYDAAGQSYQDTDSLRANAYHAGIDGLVFLVDPFTLPQLRASLRAAANGRTEGDAAEDPQAVYDRLTTELRNHGRLDAVPIAVVVTKVDALPADLRGSLAAAVGADDESAHAEVREWLCAQGAGNLVRGIEFDFRLVRYHASGWLAGEPGATPARAGVPLRWLIGGIGVRLPAHGALREA